MGPIANLLWPTAVFVLCMLAVVGGAFATLHLFVLRPRLRPRRSGLLREPAQAGRRRLAYVDHRLVAAALGAALALFFWTLLYPDEARPAALVIYAGAGVVALGWFGQELLRFWPERAALVRTIAGQARSAVSLNLLMRRKYWVFHDLHIHGERIPHLVIGPRGVFCVDTVWRPNRGRLGPTGRRPAPPAEIAFDGETLRFPGWSETGVLAAAEARAQRFGQWLAAAAGEPAENVPTRAAVALPGWRVTATHWKRVIVFNPGTPNMLIEGAPEARRIDTTTTQALLKVLRRELDEAADPRVPGGSADAVAHADGPAAPAPPAP